MTDDGVMVLANGVVIGRDEVRGSSASSPESGSFRIEAPRLVRAGADDAVLVYRGVAQRDGDADPFVALMASVYVRSAGFIQLVPTSGSPSRADANGASRSSDGERVAGR